MMNELNVISPLLQFVETPLCGKSRVTFIVLIYINEWNWSGVMLLIYVK